MTDQSSDLALKTLLTEFERSGAHELHLRAGAFELHLSRDVGAPSILRDAVPSPGRASASPPPVPAAHAPARVAAPAAIPPGAVIVAAPNLGTFYRAPKPGAAPYVEVGDAVCEGDELCLIEVMKLFTAVSSGASGRIAAVLADDGAMVEAGAPLFAIEPA